MLIGGGFVRTGAFSGDEGMKWAWKDGDEERAVGASSESTAEDDGLSAQAATLREVVFPVGRGGRGGRRHSGETGGTTD